MESNTKAIFKIKMGDDLRRWSCEAAPPTFSELLDKTVRLFAVPGETLLLRYQDDEGDMVTLACDEDVREAVNLALMASNKPVVRLEVQCTEPNTKRVVTLDSPRLVELENVVHRLEAEAAKYKRKAEEFGHWMGEKAERKVNLVHDHAKEAIQQVDASLKNGAIVRSIQEVLTQLTPRGESAADCAAREALSSLHNLLPGRFAFEPEKLEEAELPVHHGVICDASGMDPIVGVRYKKKGENFDLCQAEFDKLNAEAQSCFIRIEHPKKRVKPRLQKKMKQLAVHKNVECDISGMRPILGPRYNKKGADYDLCEAEFQKLDEVCRALFQRIDYPGAEPVDMASAAESDKHSVALELESRHGWCDGTLMAVKDSQLAQTMEKLQAKLPPPVFEAAVQAVEPVFTISDKYLLRCLDAVEPIVAALAHDESLLDAVQEMVAAMVKKPEAFTQPFEGVPPFADMLQIVGAYECRLFDDTEHKNDWHRVKVTASENGDHLVWTNAVGVSWRLYPTEHSVSYRVDEECPYFADGHMFVGVEVASDGTVSQLSGPGGEPYTARDPFYESFLPPSRPVVDHDVFPVDEPVDELHKMPEDMPEEPVRMREALADLGIAKADLSASRLAEVENALVENMLALSPEQYFNETEAARASAEAEAAELVAAAEAEAEAATNDKELSVAAALQAMGLDEEELSASMLAEIEHVVSNNAAQAEQAVLEESAREAEESEQANAAEAQAAAEEAQAKAEAAVKAAAEAAVTAYAEAQAQAAAEDANAAESAALDPVLQSLVERLVAMGFARAAAQTAVLFTEGNLERAINVLLTYEEDQEVAPPASVGFSIEPEVKSDTLSEDSTVWSADWDEMLEELHEMGFEDVHVNRSVLAEVHGDVKDAVKELVSRERNQRVHAKIALPS